MGVLNQILHELDESFVIANVTGRHDDARVSYQLRGNTVSSDAEFDEVITDYYNYHYTRCVSGGGSLTRAEAGGRAKNILEHDYRNHGMDKFNAYADGKTGQNSGMRHILDIIADRLKHEALENHIREVLDRYVAPTGFEEQTSVIRELIERMRIPSDKIDTRHPERYARHYEELIRGIVHAMNSHYASFRRL
jgi:hypothetical protein